MIKPWSISTTVRSPKRIRDFLTVLKILEGEVWDKPTQKKFQVLLIQKRFYGYGNAQFYSNLTTAQKEIIDGDKDIEFSQAEEILNSKVIRRRGGI